MDLYVYIKITAAAVPRQINTRRPKTNAIIVIKGRNVLKLLNI